jgi:hypothetical protein
VSFFEFLIKKGRPDGRPAKLSSCQVNNSRHDLDSTKCRD